MARTSRSPSPITVKLRTSRKGAEAVRLEVERLAARHGVPASAVTVRRVRERATRRS